MAARSDERPLLRYAAVLAALLLLTALTVGAAGVQLGALQGAVALAIAAAKAALVAWFFMHLGQSTRVVKLWAGSALLFFAVLLALTLGEMRGRAAAVSDPLAPRRQDGP